MDSHAARRDLELVKDIVQRASQRIDAQAFHSVHWGVIVLIWFPLANYWESQGNMDAYTWTCGLGVASGAILSTVRGTLANRKPRLPGGNTQVSNQLAWIAFANLFAGIALSSIAPATGFIDGRNVPIIWGLVYANMTFMMGLAYSRDFMISGLCIMLGCLASILYQPYNGYILGPCMGFGMLIPGLRAEARVRRFLAADAKQAQSA